MVDERAVCVLLWEWLLLLLAYALLLRVRDEEEAGAYFSLFSVLKLYTIRYNGWLDQNFTPERGDIDIGCLYTPTHLGSDETASLETMPSVDPEFGDQIHDNDTAALAGYKQRSISPLPRRCTPVQSSARDRTATSVALYLSHSLVIRCPARIRESLVRWEA
jgi:hypothetical protein